MSWSPQAFDGFWPTAWVAFPALSSYQPTSPISSQEAADERSFLLFRAVVVPARQAYSHCASVGSVYRYPFGNRPADISLAVNLSEKFSASRKLTESTGRSSPLKLEGFMPMTTLYCGWVTSYRPIQKPCVRTTVWRVSFASRPSSPSGLPIVNVPGGHQTISRPTPEGSDAVKPR